MTPATGTSLATHPFIGLADMLPLGVVAFAADGALIASNSRARDWFGSLLMQAGDREALAGLLGPSAADLPHLDDGGRAVVVLGPRLFEFCVRSTPGGQYWLVQDVSEELRLRAQLAEEGSLLAHVQEAFLVVDRHGVVRYANHHAERERSADPNGLVGRGLAELERLCGPTYQDARAQTADEVRQRCEEVLRGRGSVRYHALHRRLDGGELPVEAVMRPHRLSGETVVLISARDDGRRLMHLQALVQAKDEAETSNRAKSAFLAITSHELRTPLTGIIGFCELLQMEVAGAPQPIADNCLNHLRPITESSRSLLAIINDICDLAKIEARQLEVRPTSVDPEHLLDITEHLWRERVQAKGLQLRRLPPAGAPVRITADGQRVRQILDNLISNALKFTERGRIEISTVYGAEAVEYAVADTGCGVPEEARPQLFSAFWQAADHHTRVVGGNGLGLYICRQLADLLGGKVWLDRTSTAGSVFRLRLPKVGGDTRRSGRVMKSGTWSVPPPRSLPGN